MRTLRFLGMTLLMVMLAVNFTACSDDEEEQTIIDQANLIGKWLLRPPTRRLTNCQTNLRQGSI